MPITRLMRGSAPSIPRSGTGGGSELARAGDQQGAEDASDRFPKVDAASQQARLAYWTKTLATLDSIPFDQLSAEEKVNAQVFRTSIRALANDIKYQTYEAPFNSDTFFWTQFTPREGLPTANAYRAYLRRLARRAALLRRADRQHARRPRARLHRAARVGRRPRQDDRAVRAGRRRRTRCTGRSRRCRPPSPRPIRRRCARKRRR